MNFITTTNCPICGTVTEFKWETTEIPHFGEAMLIASVCDHCGFKQSDTILLNQGEPTRYTFKIENVDDLNVRVIKSTSGTIRLPDLGIDMEPGPTSEAYVSNVESVLRKISNIVAFATRSAQKSGSEDRVQRGEEILDYMELVLEGRQPLLMILEDPLGNSSIVSDNAISSPLTKEECEELNTGMTILDVEH